MLSAKEQYKALEEALKLSKETIASAEELAQGAQHELNEKVKLKSQWKIKRFFKQMFYLYLWIWSF